MNKPLFCKYTGEKLSLCKCENCGENVGVENLVIPSSKLIKELAEEIVETSINKPYDGYMSHGEYHSYKIMLTVDEVIEIINKKFNVASITWPV